MEAERTRVSSSDAM